jgi:3'-phosphoadenosine 5'-phosphosulfate sulfotransferase (PAPS reductase)/FAD synthetase
MSYENKVSREELKKLQSLSLEQKIDLTLQKIKEFYEFNKGKVYVSFSGGKDSTVLLHLVRLKYPDVSAVYVNTGLEYPEINEFVKTIDNVIELRPKMLFSEVIKKYGYPAVSKKVARQIRDLRNPTDKNINTRRLYLEGIKRDGTKTKTLKLSKKWHKLIDAPFDISEQCCDIMKKEPMKRYQKETKSVPFIGTMASDSYLRETSYLNYGCNNFIKNQSTPMGFWLEQDIWDCIKMFELPYSKIYDTGVKRTGCMFCMFGVHLEKEPNRFQLMKKTHPQLHDYCMNNLGCKKVCDFIGARTE